MAKRKSQISKSRVNKHHLLWQGRHWNRGYAKALRNESCFIIYMPMLLHNEIHSIISGIPVPDGALCKSAYSKFCEDKQCLNSATVVERINWLINNLPAENFQKAMELQKPFFANNLELDNANRNGFK